MSTHEWDMREAHGAEGRAVDLFQTLEREVNRLRDKVNALEIELLIADEAHAAVTGERDRAIDRCVARVVRDGSPGLGYPFNVSAEQFRADAAEDAGLA